MDVDPPPPLSPIHGFIPLEPELPKPPPSLPPPLTASGQPYRQCRLPRRFTDNLPEVLAPVPIHLVLPKFGSEPKFKPEPLGPNSKFSSKFSQS